MKIVQIFGFSERVEIEREREPKVVQYVHVAILNAKALDVWIMCSVLFAMDQSEFQIFPYVSKSEVSQRIQHRAMRNRIRRKERTKLFALCYMLFRISKCMELFGVPMNYQKRIRIFWNSGTLKFDYN